MTPNHGLTDEQRITLINCLAEFVERVSTDKKASPAELAVLPEIVKVLLCR